MQREIIKWLQSLDLSYQVRHPRQDLSNGFTLAEIASRYDRRIAMHSYVPGCSTECKRRNWKVLLGELKRLGCTSVTAEMAEATIQGKPDVALMVLDCFYEFFCNRPAPPRLTERNEKNKMLLLRAIDAARAATTHSVATTLEPKPISLQFIENDEITLGKGIQQPGFARPTAASLLHVTNSDARNAVLVAAVPADELRILKCNEKLLSEHKMLHKAYRFAEPQRFAPVNHKRLATLEKKAGKAGTSVKGSPCDHGVSADRVSVVELNMLNKQLLSALQQREAYDTNNVTDSSEESRNAAVVKLLDACGNNLRLGFSKMLGATLESNGFTEFLAELNTGNEEEDLLSFFVGRREEMPFSAVVACWSTLLNASNGIVSTLCIRPTEYMYILRALRFIFTPDTVRTPLLHVSASPEVRVSQKGSSDAGSTLTHDVCPFTHSMSVPDTFHPVTEETHAPQQIVLSNERVFNVTSAFLWLCSIGEAVNAVSPQLACSLLMNYFVPTASRFFCASSVAILEALARVVVAHICGDSAAREKRKSVVTPDEDREQPQLQPSEKVEWNAALQLTSLLAGPLKTAFVGRESANSRNSVSKETQYKLFLFHVLRLARVPLNTNDIEHEVPTAAKAEVQHDAAITLKALVASVSPVASPSTPVELCAGGVLASLGSSSMQQRSIGLAMLIQFLAWDRWDLAMDPLLLVLNDVKQRGTFGGFLQRAAEAWEMRLLLLELLTITFRKILYVFAEASETMDHAELKAPASTNEERRLSVADAIRQKIHLTDVEEATVLCLEIFFEAPLLQRHLALQIVGARLLPDEQRNVAAMWVRGLFLFSVEQLEFMLRPHEAEPLHLQDSTFLSQHRVHGVPLRLPGVPAIGLDEEGEAGFPSSPPHQLRSVESLKEAVSSVHVLLGRVEPAYIVSPLNQSWDTFSVVQATLMFEDILTSTQVFSVVLAAILSPQRREAQRLRLLRNLRAVSGGASSATTSTTEHVGDEGKAPPDAVDVEGDAGESALNVTLKSLVATYDQKSTVGKEMERGVETAREDAAGTLAVSDTNVIAAVASGAGDEVSDVAENEETKREIREEEEEEVDPATLLERHEKAFWISVLRLLRAQLQQCLTRRLSLEEQRKKKRQLLGTTPNMDPLASVCRITRTDSAARLKELATGVLLTLYHRYGGAAAEAMSKETCLLEACQWLDKV
ncbi:spermatogenesis-associated protein 4 [Trypanosoma rangeli]|uniref:Spermatogenesis-associated protein 4 n=1 Tax=Trypanosoma rangeli TaxID=5698 RepID=A0A3R7LDC9_TRYRA|nr:spermatogenesis-associated protein 4 [Trypanosoma rangeli]RNF12171.1 spermatogenesis-associated protein 4 [Trypanosoma rangeli]|eukprot:RNF12171.1 spermatogenesis-associated protein 4 [Trypanosoma rangeli]